MRRLEHNYRMELGEHDYRMELGGERGTGRRIRSGDLWKLLFFALHVFKMF